MRLERFWPLPALVAALLLPWLPGLPPYWVVLANYVGIAAIVALGLVVLTGVAGITSFGQATFLGFGAYTTALLSTSAGLSPWLTLPLALAVSGVAALAIGAITVRLSGHYLAVGTIAWSVSFYYLFANLDLFGRNDGIVGIPPLAIGGFALLDERAYAGVVWSGVVLAALASANLLESRVGRTLRALRGGSVAAASCGVAIARARILAFVYAALLAAFAGWLYAHMQRAVNPSPFSLTASIEYLLMAVVGGAAHLPGALLGAALVTLANNTLQDLSSRLLGGGGDLQTILFGAALVLVLQVSPQGLWPHLFPGRLRRHRALAGAASLPRRSMPPAGTPILAVEGLCRNFGGLTALNAVDFALAAGEIVGLIGPNGAGKTTTFNLLTGVDRPNGGAIRFLGRPLAGRAAPAVARLGIARTFQQVKLVAGMSVIENVVLGAHLRGRAGPLAALLRLDRAEEARLYAEAAYQLARVGLADAADRPAPTHALGQQRLVEIARALCLDPLLLLLDEPAAGLRHHEKEELATLLTRLRAEGMTILLVEHDIDFVMGLSDRLVVLDFGTKLAEGPPDSVRDDPAVIEAYLGGVA
jgi:branched-chain amino acid transport system permease protein